MITFVHTKFQQLRIQIHFLNLLHIEAKLTLLHAPICHALHGLLRHTHTLEGLRQPALRRGGGREAMMMAHWKRAVTPLLRT